MFEVLAKLWNDCGVSIALKRLRCLYIRNVPLKRLKVLEREEHIVHFCTKSLVVMSCRFSLFMCPSLSRTCKSLNTIATRNSNADIQAATLALKNAVAEVQRRLIQNDWQSQGWRSDDWTKWYLSLPPKDVLTLLWDVWGVAKLWNVWSVHKALKCLRR